MARSSEAAREVRLNWYRCRSGLITTPGAAPSRTKRTGFRCSGIATPADAFAGSRSRTLRQGICVRGSFELNRILAVLKGPFDGLTLEEGVVESTGEIDCRGVGDLALHADDVVDVPVDL